MCDFNNEELNKKDDYHILLKEVFRSMVITTEHFLYL